MCATIEDISHICQQSSHQTDLAATDNLIEIMTVYWRTAGYPRTLFELGCLNVRQNLLPQGHLRTCMGANDF